MRAWSIIVVLAVACGGPAGHSRPPNPEDVPPRTNDPGAVLDQRPHPERGRPGPEGGHGEVQGLRPGAPTTADQLPDGQPCWISADCLSGVCEGQGCDDGHLGRCMPRTRVCTEDVSPFCGCDGRTFTASSSCPGTRYAKPDACR